MALAKRLLLSLLAICLMLGAVSLGGCGTNGGGDKDTQAPADTTGEQTTDDTNREDPMKSVTICGKKLSSFRIIADKTSTPAGVYLQNTLKQRAGARLAILLSVADINRTYTNLPYIQVVTLPINGEVYSLRDNEVKLFEENGNFRIVVGSRKVSELTAVKYFVENVLDGSVADLRGYSEVACLPEDEIVTPLIEQAEARKAEIESAENHYTAADVKGAGKCYYVSFSQGNDENDGLSPEKPWKTITKVSTASIPEGSVVLFKRGDTWRLDDYSRATVEGGACWLKLQSGVIYSSYGTGAKPTLSGSPRDMAKVGSWSETEYKNVWVYSEAYDGMDTIKKSYNDVGNLIFNGGEAFGYKMVKGVAGSLLSKDFGEAGFSGFADMSINYEFWFDPEDCKVYLYYDGGNPGEVFESIEGAVRLNLMRASGKHNIVVDNFILTYGGAHGVSTATVDNVKITSCEFRWMGGGIYDSDVSVTRYGNGIEFNMKSKNCYAENNLFYQIYDTGITHQFDSRNKKGDRTECYHENMNYLNNVFEYCFFSIEYFESHTNTTTDVSRYQKDITISGNYSLYANYGFGYWVAYEDRSFGVHIQGWNQLDCEFQGGAVKCENNVFLLAKYRMIAAKNESDTYVINLKNNTFVQLDGNGGFMLGTQVYEEDDGYTWNADAAAQNKYLKDKGNRFLTVQ